MSWHSSWLNGEVPMDLAPSLYALAWRKKRLVRDDVTNHNWTRGLWRMESANQMAEFIHLWDLVQQAHLSNQGNRIEWKWTANGKYSDKLAYLIQFRGSYCTFNAKNNRSNPIPVDPVLN
jgi:hypothetical protein